MTLLSRQMIETLISTTDKHLLSLYFPTHRAGKDIQQDAIRLKNLTNRAEEELRARGVGASTVDRLLQPLRDLVLEHGFWEHQSDGLAIFRSEDIFQVLRVPLYMEERLEVGPRFYIKPLLPLLTGDGRFYVLALAQDGVRLLQGTRQTIGEILLDQVPRSVAEALRWDDPQAQVQWHTNTQDRPREMNLRGAMFFGHGVEAAGDHDEHILRFFQLVDQGVTEILAEERAPLVLAGVKDIRSIYRQANTYRDIVDEGVDGNPEEWSNAELHRRAWPLVRPLLDADREEAEALCRQLLGQHSRRASSDVQDVVLAAHTGGIEVLFLVRSRDIMGAIDPETLHVRASLGEDEEGRDLTELLAVRTIAYGGRVYLELPQEMPGGGLVAALLRHDVPEAAAP